MPQFTEKRQILSLSAFIRDIRGFWASEEVAADDLSRRSRNQG